MRQAMVYAILLLLMYIPPYTILKESSPLALLLYWTTLGISGLAYAWAETRGWGKSG